MSDVRASLCFVSPGNSSLSASTLVTVHILDVNDNSPVLVGDYSWKYLCTPRWEDQALVLASRDSDGPLHGGRLNFSLRSDAAVRRNWKLTPINGQSIPDRLPTCYIIPGSCVRCCTCLLKQELCDPSLSVFSNISRQNASLFP